MKLAGSGRRWEDMGREMAEVWDRALGAVVVSRVLLSVLAKKSS